jgi:hypothetical protein
MGGIDPSIDALTVALVHFSTGKLHHSTPQESPSERLAQWVD